MKHSKKESQVTTAVEKPNWPPPRQTGTPPRATVRLIFAGLQGFCYKPSSRTCEVGFCKSNRHKARIAVFEKPGCKPTIVNAGPGRMSVGITGLAAGPTTSYQGAQFDRFQGEDKDIRWMLDLADWYPGYTMATGYFPQILEVLHGMFFTIVRSNSTFKRVNGAGGKVEDLGYVGRYLGADIEITSGQSVTLDTGSVRIVLPWKQTTSIITSYEVVFANECYTSCTGPDFHSLIDTLGATTFYDVGLEVKGPPSFPGGCTSIDISADQLVGSTFEERSFFSPFNTDDAPCMGAGFGQSNGFPQ